MKRMISWAGYIMMGFGLGEYVSLILGTSRINSWIGVGLLVVGIVITLVVDED